jgi:hypothetical protein
MPEHSHVFVAGLHRSGTSLLTRALASHPEASTFTGTGFPEDEGQFLQRAYPVAKVYGGPGRFGFDPRAHLTESAVLAKAETGTRLRAEWDRHWDLSKRVLIEKSPPNLLKLRFLQEVYPQATFVVMTRHPIAVALATEKWSLTSQASLIRHWLRCHETFLRDAPRIGRLIVTSYEDVVADPGIVTRILDHVGADDAPLDLAPRSGVNETYFERWTTSGKQRQRTYRASLARLFERRANRFGYSLRQPERRLAPGPEIAALRTLPV